MQNFFFFQAEDGIRDDLVTGVQTCALPILDKLLTGLAVNEERCRQLIDQSLMMVTSLAPKIGYEQAAAFAKEAFDTGKTIRELCRERKIMPDAELDDALDPM